MSESTPPGDPPVAGVEALDHTADVGLELRAPDLPELLRRAALGLGWLLTEAAPPDPVDERRLQAEATDDAQLLRVWLRELLHWHNEDGFLPAELEVEQAEDGRVTATVRGGVPERGPIREIKGVTLHGLVAERRDGGWVGRVVFDV